MIRPRRKRGKFHRQSVAPSIFAVGDRNDLVPQLAIGLAVKDARRRAYLPFPDPDHNLGIAPDILDPRGRFACFGEQIKNGRRGPQTKSRFRASIPIGHAG